MSEDQTGEPSGDDKYVPFDPRFLVDVREVAQNARSFFNDHRLEAPVLAAELMAKMDTDLTYTKGPDADDKAVAKEWNYLHGCLRGISTGKPILKDLIAHIDTYRQLQLDISVANAQELMDDAKLVFDDDPLSGDKAAEWQAATNRYVEIKREREVPTEKLLFSGADFESLTQRSRELTRSWHEEADDRAISALEVDGPDVSSHQGKGWEQ